MMRSCIWAGMRLPVVCVLLYVCALEQTSTNDLNATLSVVSPYAVAGEDARIQVTVSSDSGRGLSAALLDPACLQIFLEGGAVRSPAAEGLSDAVVDLGTHASLSRVIDLKDACKGLKTQTVEVAWHFEGAESARIPLRIYAWDLVDVEAVIQTDHGEMVAELYADKAPITVKNFVDLSMKGFYDNSTFHRVVPDFMIQGGCPNGDGTGDPGYFIKGEFTDISHVRGTLSMARTQDPDSGGCQFFIMHGDNPSLDGLYAAFGRLTSGWETLDRIAGVQLTSQRTMDEISRPVERQRIKTITIRKKVMNAGKDR